MSAPSPTPPSVNGPTDPTDLLVALYGVVARDRAPSGLEGRAAVGVESGGQRVWWNVRLGRAVEQSIDDALMGDAQAALLLGAAEAQALLQGGVLPAEAAGVRIYGDRALVEKLVRRYLVPSSSLELRAGSTLEAASAKRTGKKNGSRR